MSENISRVPKSDSAEKFEKRDAAMLLKRLKEHDAAIKSETF